MSDVFHPSTCPPLLPPLCALHVDWSPLSLPNELTDRYGFQFSTNLSAWHACLHPSLNPPLPHLLVRACVMWSRWKHAIGTRECCEHHWSQTSSCPVQLVLEKTDCFSVKVEVPAAGSYEPIAELHIGPLNQTNGPLCPDQIVIHYFSLNL